MLLHPVRYIHLHLRFYGCAALGTAVGAVCWWLGLPAVAPAGDVFFASYLLATAWLRFEAAPEDMRRSAEREDEGVALIIALTLGAVAISAGALFSLLAGPDRPGTLHLLLSVISVPLGWTGLHTVMAIHYAHLFYARRPDNPDADAGGLEFPGTPEPRMWDFLYYSFVVGMTAQVSDVQVTDPELRRTTLGHSIVSFFYNTVILALAVNVAVAQGQ